MSTQQTTTKFQDFNAKDLTFTKFEENERSKAQNLAFPRYKETQRLMLQGPWIDMNAYGVPQLGEYYKTDKDRAFIKIPLDLNNPEIKEFYDKLQTIDEMMNSKEFKAQQFGDKAKKYKYAYPICRVPMEDEDEEDEKKKSKYPRPPYMKVKLDATWPETKILTQVYTSVMKDGKREREKQEVESVDDFANVVRYLSKIRPIIQPVKAWCEKKGKMGKDFLEYGLTFKLIKVEVEPHVGGGSNLSQYMNNDAFIDSDEENDDDKSKFQGKPVAPNSIKNISTLPLVNKNKKDSDDEEEDPQVDKDEDEDEDEEDEEEEEEEPEPVKPVKAKGTTKGDTKAPAKSKSKSK
jgi:hypothetical protein